MGYLGIGILILGVLTAVMGHTRTAQLKRMAHTLGLKYDPHLDGVLTEDQMMASCFFRQGKHHFKHVLTCKDSGAFIRICEDEITGAKLDSTSLLYTLVTVELTRGDFCPFILMPRRPRETVPSGSLPPELAEKYVLSAPADFTLPQELVGLLKAVPPCYLELTSYALIYHEFSVLPVDQIQPLRYRVIQIMKALVQNSKSSVAPATAPISDDLLQAQVSLKLQQAAPAFTRRSGGRWVYGLVLLFMLGSLLFLASYVLSHWITK
ncbi:MAG: hypothetical protein J6Y25_05285 [Elusimicrobiaceae bacterium]|nr:hypothetical protein [Elusimicrobiaceae bacterium]MBP5617412.1 hypothetical protein [Elusimicrobiaceae bacterium]